ncbi:ATP-dependent RNA helicase dbpA [uncultured Clostridium sp.]|nr:ATP-dependent RNA helicase dbpA [uncultured Clostridium sp.]
MNLSQMLEHLKGDPVFMQNVTGWHIQPAQAARTLPFPHRVAPELRAAYEKRGIRQLYTHQRQAFDALEVGKNVVVVTPTASGKTLCYNLPVLNAIARDENARALYLFPTKALSSDQVSAVTEIVDELGKDIKAFTYDGDTSVSARAAVRQAAHIVVTNPDMLHSGIMPHHTKWVKLFENLRYIVIDEVHTYRGVFGSHLCNVLRRLKRICEFYGSHPQFICCSATIDNPKELAESICRVPMELVDDNGAPRGERHFIFYNPPLVNRQLGVRKNAVIETRKIATELIRNHIQTIVFARSRVNVEVLTNYLGEAAGSGEKIRGYRGGYLPSERRAIERGLRAGEILGVVSTNALELGIDIGSLEASVLCGFPGTIASTWQQAGRAGRRAGESLTILVATSSPLDQYIIRHPEYFFTASPEQARINPDNLYILLSHFKCAAYELPFMDGETFGTDTAQPLLEFLQDEKILRHVGGRWHWMSEEFPASEISLRTAVSENFVVVNITNPEHPKVIGEMDKFTVPMLLHEQAIYLHQGRQYQVEKLDWENRKGYVREVNVDYYTDANMLTSLRVLDVLRDGERAGIPRFSGEVLVSEITTLFKKFKLDTHENVGWGKVHLPQQDMHTTAYWLTLPAKVREKYTVPQIEKALGGIANLLRNIAPVLLMCDPMDIRVQMQVRGPFTEEPTLFLYDNYPGGMGFADRLYELHEELLGQALKMLESCECESGCPSCVGPALENGEDGKYLTRKVLEAMLA